MRSRPSSPRAGRRSALPTRLRVSVMPGRYRRLISRARRRAGAAKAARLATRALVGPPNRLPVKRKDSQPEHDREAGGENAVLEALPDEGERVTSRLWA